uniref:Uncharacterized protein n=1 Tax=Macrostomum lignano TaxID=282301 RepID=A0A1I8HN12_9PLAT
MEQLPDDRNDVKLPAWRNGNSLSKVFCQQKWCFCLLFLALLLNAALFAVFIARSPQSIASEQRHPGCCDKMELIQQRLEMLERSLEEMKLSAPLKETAAGAKESYQPSIRKRRSAVESPSCTCPPGPKGEKGDRVATAEPTYDETKLKRVS